MNIDSKPENDDTEEDTDEGAYEIQQFFEILRLQKSLSDKNRDSGKKLMIKFEREITCNKCLQILVKCDNAQTRYKTLHMLSNLVSNLTDISENPNILNHLIEYATKNQTIVSAAVVSRALAKCIVILMKNVNLSICEVINNLLQNVPDDLHWQSFVTHIVQQTIQYCDDTIPSQDIIGMFDTTLSMLTWKHITNSTTNISKPKSIESKHLFNVVDTIKKLVYFKCMPAPKNQQCLSICAECHIYLFEKFRHNNYMQHSLSTLRKIILRIFAQFNTPKTSILGGANGEDIDLKTAETSEDIDATPLKICEEILIIFEKKILNVVDYDDVDNALLCDVCEMIHTIVVSFGLEINYLTERMEIVQRLWTHMENIITFLSKTHKYEIFLDNIEWNLITDALKSLQQYQKLIKTPPTFEQYKICVKNLLIATTQGNIKLNDAQNNDYIRIFQHLKTFGTITQCNNDAKFAFLQKEIKHAFNVMKQETSAQDILPAQINLTWLFLLMRFVSIEDIDRCRTLHNYLKQWMDTQCNKTLMLTDTVIEIAVSLFNSECILWGMQIEIYEMLIQKCCNDIALLLSPTQRKCHDKENDAKCDNQNNYLNSLKRTIHLLKSLIDKKISNKHTATLDCFKNSCQFKILQKKYEQLIYSKAAVKQIETTIISLLTPIVLKLHTNKKDSIISKILKQFNEQTNLLLITLTNYNVSNLKNNKEIVMQRIVAMVHGLSSEKEGVDILVNAQIQYQLFQLLSYFRTTNQEITLLHLFEIVSNITSKLSSISSAEDRLSMYNLISNVLQSMGQQTKCKFSDGVYIQILNLAKLQINMINVNTSTATEKNSTAVLLNFMQMLTRIIPQKRGQIVFNFWKFISVWVQRSLLSSRMSDGELNLLMTVIEMSLRSGYSTVRRIGRTIVEHIAKSKKSFLKQHLRKSTYILINALKDTDGTHWEFPEISNSLCSCLLAMQYSAREFCIWNSLEQYVEKNNVDQAKKSVVFFNELLENINLQKIKLTMKFVMQFFDEMSVFCNYKQ
eukprot:487887_1